MNNIYSRCVCKAQVSDPIVHAYHTWLCEAHRSLPSLLPHGPVQGIPCHVLGCTVPSHTDYPGNRAYVLVTCFRKPLHLPPLCGQFRGPIIDKETSWFRFGVLCLSDLWEEVLGTGISLLLLFPTEYLFLAPAQRSLFSRVSVVCSRQLTMMLIDLWACRQIEKS